MANSWTLGQNHHRIRASFPLIPPCASTRKQLHSEYRSCEAPLIAALSQKCRRAQPVGMARMPDFDDPEPSFFKHPLQGVRIKMSQMPGQVQTVPTSTEPLPRHAREIGDGDDKTSAGQKQTMCLLQRSFWLVNVFERMPHRDEIETGKRQFVMRQRSGKSANAGACLKCLHRRCGNVKPHWLPTESRRSNQEVSGAAAKIK